MTPDQVANDRNWKDFNGCFPVRLVLHGRRHIFRIKVKQLDCDVVVFEYGFDLADTPMVTSVPNVPKPVTGELLFRQPQGM